MSGNIFEGPNFFGGSPLTVEGGGGTITNTTTLSVVSGGTITSGGPGVALLSISGGGGGGGSSVTLQVTKSQLLTLNSAPLQVLPGQGPNTIVNITKASILYEPGADLFVQSGVSANLSYTGSTGQPRAVASSSDANGNTPFQGPNFQFMTGLISNAVGGILYNSDVINAGITFSTSSDLGVGAGPIATTDLNDGGILAAVGDTGTITTGSNDATLAVTAVTGSLPIISITPGPGTASTVVCGPGDQAARLNASNFLRVTGTVAFDGDYPVNGGATFNGTNTVVLCGTGTSLVTAGAGGFITSDLSAATAFSLTDAGSTYVPASGVAVTPGVVLAGGSGIAVDILTVNSTPPTNSGTATVIMDYEVLAVSP